jgi:hypothetical protein
MKYLIILLFAFAACSDEEPEIGCAQLKADTEEAFKAHRAYAGDDEGERQRLYNIYKQKADLHFSRRCP